MCDHFCLQAFISRVDYCNSILYQAAAVHLRPFQLVLNAAARLVVKRRIRDSITQSPTIHDNLHWLLVRQRVDCMTCLYWPTSVFTSSSLRIPRVDDQSGFGSLYMPPFAIWQVRLTWLCRGLELLADEAF